MAGLEDGAPTSNSGAPAAVLIARSGATQDKEDSLAQ
jgi:hypothetical protein